MTDGICGIDFGTTNSAIGVALDSHIELVRMSSGLPPELLRSVVYLDRLGQRIAGGEAINQYALNATKQHVCSRCELATFTRSGIDSRCHWARAGGGCADSRLVNGPKEFLAQHHLDSTHSWAQTFSMDKLVATVLDSLRKRAEGQTGTHLRNAVIGIPVKFAMEQAGADRERALQRLTAAAHAVGFERVEFLV